MNRYLFAHWRGDQPMLVATLINGVLGYFVVVAVMFGFSRLTPGTTGLAVSVVLSVVWAIWASVGIVRCALKRYIPAQQPAWRRLVGFVIVVLVVVVDVLLARDVWFIFPR